MYSTKHLFAIKTIFFVVSLFCLQTIQAYEYRLNDTTQMLGFPRIKYELAINPCLKESLIYERYGEQGVTEARQNLKRYPQGICEHEHVASMLFRWNYSASALLANTGRPFILGKEITHYHAQLEQCKVIDCLAALLPRMIEWAQTTLSRMPVLSRDVEPLNMGGTPIAYPQLAFRGLELPLTQQYQVCGSEDWSALRFTTSTSIVAGSALVVINCQSNARFGTWLLERRENSEEWKEILVLPGVNNVSVLPHNRELHPHVFYTEKKDDMEWMTILRYTDRGGYQKHWRFEVSKDASGLRHAFNVEVF